jgi:cell division septum initiation protein DivIVA
MRSERENVDVHAKLAEIRRVVEEARSLPMSASVVVNRGELLGLLDELGAELETAFVEAEAVLADREGEVAKGREEAERIIADATNEQERIVSDTEVYRVAKREADNVVERAEDEAEGLRNETDDYVDAKLANFEISLERTLEAVKRGRERLAGRSAFHALTVDDIDEIKLPEHLEG